MSRWITLSEVRLGLRPAEAIAAVSDAEGRAGKNDPAEGKVVIGKLVGGQLVDERTSESVSPLQADVRRMLNAT